MQKCSKHRSVYRLLLNAIFGQFEGSLIDIIYEVLVSD